jgi:hypothetical protein
MRPVSGLAILSLNPSLQMKLTDDYPAGNTDAHKSPVDERYRLFTTVTFQADVSSSRLSCMDDPLKSLVRTLLEREGFWVRSGFKVRLTPEDKAALGGAWPPREIDFVAYKAPTNALRFVGCAPYLDSRGVRLSSFTRANGPDEYRLFTDGNVRGVVTNRIISQLTEAGGCLPGPSVAFHFVAPKIRDASERQSLRQHFEQNAWVLWDDEWLNNVLSAMSKGGRETDVSSAVAKLLLSFFGYNK